MALSEASLPGDLQLCLDQDYGESTAALHVGVHQQQKHRHRGTPSDSGVSRSTRPPSPRAQTSRKPPRPACDAFQIAQAVHRSPAKPEHPHHLRRLDNCSTAIWRASSLCALAPDSTPHNESTPADSYRHQPGLPCNAPGTDDPCDGDGGCSIT